MKLHQNCRYFKERCSQSANMYWAWKRVVRFIFLRRTRMIVLADIEKASAAVSAEIHHLASRPVEPEVGPDGFIGLRFSSLLTIIYIMFIDDWAVGNSASINRMINFNICAIKRNLLAYHFFHKACLQLPACCRKIGRHYVGHGDVNDASWRAEYFCV